MALNADTMLNIANGVIMYNVASMFLYKLIIDFDFSAMYPSSIIAFNIFATTMIGKLIILEYIPESTYDKDMGKEYIEDIIVGDMLHIGHKWHKLSNFETLNDKMKRKLETKMRSIA